MATYESLLLPIFGWGLAPGDALLRLLGLDPAVTAAHAEGGLFWLEFFVQFGANWIAWSLLLALIGLALCCLKGLHSRRLEKQVDPEPTQHTGLSSGMGVIVLGGLVGFVLPLFLHGLLILSRKKALFVLVEEGGLLVHLLTASLLPGEGLLYWADGSLAPFSGLSPTMNFWLSSGILLLVNGLGWLLIAALFLRLVLPWVRARRRGG